MLVEPVATYTPLQTSQSLQLVERGLALARESSSRWAEDRVGESPCDRRKVEYSSSSQLRSSAIIPGALDAVVEYCRGLAWKQNNSKNEKVGLNKSNLYKLKKEKFHTTNVDVTVIAKYR